MRITFKRGVILGLGLIIALGAAVLMKPEAPISRTMVITSADGSAQTVLRPEYKRALREVASEFTAIEMINMDGSEMDRLALKKMREHF